ncbi:enamine deaminase RidA (YjgF/YER057c/UK114 family) [Streptomyces sp. 840.1]|uniref:RidA family protein n=1 Tax=Streptomyces sp. 840.1 TaxID=2485152 RepID=UPI000F49CAE0|nr:RidA family protein [Streptomyces sp. 840.1]ROQ66860.1 enamine deaminase RidA (YjgF/YER057c/UK114 family) [Streptomyces sp. 840.1]
MSSNENAAGAARIQKIATTPDWYEPYRISQAVRAGNFVYVSGQAGFEEDGTTVEGGFLAQGRQAFGNVARVLEAAGLTFADVVKVGIFVRDMAANLPHVITLRGEFLAEPYPADTLIEVVSLAQPDWQIEVEVIALDRDAA